MGQINTPPPSEIAFDLIGRIYDCALDPSQWGATLHAINRATHFMASVLALQSLPGGEYIISVPMGYEEKWIVRLQSYMDDVVHIWGGANRAALFPLDELLVHSRMPGLPDPKQTRLYQEWAKPQGIIDVSALFLVRDESTIGSIGFSRHESAGAVSDHDTELLRILAPHLRRSLRISRLFDLTALRAETADALIEHMAAGVIFLDESLGIVDANAAGEAMLANGDPVLVKQGKLASLEATLTWRLQKVLEQSVYDEAGLAHRGIGVSIRGKSGRRWVLSILPLVSGEFRPHLRRRARAALFISPEFQSARSPESVFAEIYDLTPTEARVFNAISIGRTPSQIAEEFGVALSTVKTHLNRIFAKTDSKRQSDIVRLANAAKQQI